ncbi:MAG: sugar ABC transporter permease [Bifidobacteriaceae bacterium]|jgi:raffinose/stachyose/melibiose transport system permease protein|nr:sugar ABC transporter permease [Bifidobacteriaceae bacterium]
MARKQAGPAAGGSPLRGRAARRRGGVDGHPLTPYLLILPAFALYAVFLLYPLGQAVQISFYDWNGMTEGTFVGLENYLEIVHNAGLRAAFLHSFVLIFFYAAIPIGIGLVIAGILNRGRVRGLGFFRTVYFVPQVIALVVAATAWKSIYGYNGSLNGLLRSLGLGALARDWLGDYTLALPSVGVIGAWVELGLVVVLLLAGMARVPEALYEAARLDGAGTVREFFSITIPSVRGEIVVVATLTIIAALKNFDLVYMATKGGPGGSTSVPAYQVYAQAFQQHNVGVAAALGITLALLIFAVNLVVNRKGGA